MTDYLSNNQQRANIKTQLARQKIQALSVGLALDTSQAKSASATSTAVHNNLPYAEPLANGSSKQANAGWVQGIAKDVQGRVRIAAAKHRQRVMSRYLQRHPRCHRRAHCNPDGNSSGVSGQLSKRAIHTT
jgi:2-succinyl-5-enolpyruvyl-6-hydroxy-3-cyclohexene-1-carboxylate synthase